MSERLSREELSELARTLIERGMTVERLGRATGLGPDIVGMVMRGELLPEPHIRKRLADALGLDVRGLD